MRNYYDHNMNDLEDICPDCGELPENCLCEGDNLEYGE